MSAQLLHMKEQSGLMANGDGTADVTNTYGGTGTEHALDTLISAVRGNTETVVTDGTGAIGTSMKY